jgi:hypothetical protein
MSLNVSNVWKSVAFQTVFSFGNSQKSHRAKSGEYGGWSNFKELDFCHTQCTSKRSTSNWYDTVKIYWNLLKQLDMEVRIYSMYLKYFLQNTVFHFVSFQLRATSPRIWSRQPYRAPNPNDITQDQQCSYK